MFFDRVTGTEGKIPGRLASLACYSPCQHTWFAKLSTTWNTVILEKLTHYGQAIKKILHLLRNLKIHYRVHIPSSTPNRSQINPVYTRQPYFPKINFNIILPSTPRSLKWFLPLRLLKTKIVYAFLIGTVDCISEMFTCEESSREGDIRSYDQEMSRLL
jgi:hypothetical protein